MAKTQNVSKGQLVKLMREIVGAQETGLISILTNTRHAVLMKFFAGKLIHIHSRTRDIGDVIQVLNESDWVKFKFTRMPMDDLPEFMPMTTFLDLIEVEDDDDTTVTAALESNEAVDVTPATAPAPAPGTKSDQSISETRAIRELLIKIASEYVGPVAEMVVEEAFENNSDTEKVIEFIADSIPDPAHAAEFRAAAHKATLQAYL